MSTEPNQSNQEIDLGHVYRKVIGKMSKANDSFFDTLLYLKRHLVTVVVLVLVGATLGFFLDRSSKSYLHKMIVSPNFRSVDYLYEEVEHLNEKIREGDTLFLKSIGIKKPKKHFISKEE